MSPHLPARSSTFAILAASSRESCKKFFLDHLTAELYSIAEHETMHLLCDRLDLSASYRLRGLYAELMGYGLFSRERLFMLANGWPPPPMGKACGVNILFDFINERNFIRGMNGGHSRENLDEFCASYLHSLLYIDRLEVLLRSPVILPDGSKVRLSPSGQARLLLTGENPSVATLGQIDPSVKNKVIAPLETGRPAVKVFHAHPQAGAHGPGTCLLHVRLDGACRTIDGNLPGIGVARNTTEHKWMSGDRNVIVKETAVKIVMFTNTYLPHVGGVARSVDFFARDLRALDHDVLVVAPHFEGESREDDHVLRVPAIQNFSGSDFSVRIRLPAKVEKTIKAFDPDIIHSHHPLLMGDTALRLSRKYGLPLVFTHHTMYEQYTHHVHLDTDTVRRFVIKLVTLYTGFCDRVVAPSQSIASILQSRGVDAPIVTLPTGVDLLFFSEGDGNGFRRSHEIPDDAEVVGYLGRLAPEKNLTFLARAVADFVRKRPNAYFLVVGDGTSKEKIAAAFEAAHAIDRLRITGEAHGETLRAAYHAMDVFAFASKTETQGMVLVEAMAAGLPVIALDAPGSREVVRHNINGLLLPESISCKGFAESLLEYFLHPAERTRRELQARNTAKEFTREECARAMADLYAQVLEERRIRPPVHHEKYDVLDALVKKLKTEWDLLAEKALAATQAIHPHNEKAPAEH